MQLNQLLRFLPEIRAIIILFFGFVPWHHRCRSLFKSELRSRNSKFWGLTVGKDVILLILVAWSFVLLLIVFSLVGVPVVSFFTTSFGAVIAGLILTPVLGATVNAIAVKRGRLLEEDDVVFDPKTGQKGIVEDISMIHTKFRTLNAENFSIPNYQLRSRNLTHYTREHNLRRCEIDILITYESNVNQATNTVERVLNQKDGVLDDESLTDEKISLCTNNGTTFVQGPPKVKFDPDVQIDAFGNNGIVVKGLFWVKEPCTVPKLKSNVRRELIRRFEVVDVDFAYPHSQIILDENGNEVKLDLNLFGD